MSYSTYPSYQPISEGFLDQIPARWGFDKLKYTAAMNSEVLREDTDPDYEFEYVDIGSVTLGVGIQETERMKFADAPSRARRKVKTGDVIVSTVRTYLKAIAPIEAGADDLIVSTGFCVVRPRNSLHAGYCNYMLQAPFFVDAVVADSVGVSYPATNSSTISNIRIPLPDPDEQSTIATFLDRETAKIDTLIDQQEQLIKLLEEKQQAVILHAVTEGLNPDVRMKDSGVEWLGEVPENWEINRVKAFFSERDARSETGDEELLSVSHLTGVTPRSEKDVNMFMAESMVGYKQCGIGDLVVNTMWAWMGAMGSAFVEGIVRPSYNVYRIRDEARIHTKFVDYLVRIPQFISLVTSRSTGIWSSRLRLYPQALFDLRIALPPYSEQKAVAEHLDKMLSRYEDISKRCSKGVRLLQERRTALISAAVTGKIDVREAV